MTFRGELLGTAQNTSSQLLLYTEQWIAIDGRVAVQGVSLRADNSCPVEIRNLSDPLCHVGSTTAVIVGTTVAVSVVLVFLAVLVCVAIKKCRR